MSKCIRDGEVCYTEHATLTSCNPFDGVVDTGFPKLFHPCVSEEWHVTDR